jgi:hypothetical protein
MKYRFRDSTHLLTVDVESPYDHLERLISGVLDRKATILRAWNLGESDERRNEELSRILNEYNVTTKPDITAIKTTSAYLNNLEKWFADRMEEYENEPDMKAALEAGLNRFKNEDTSDLREIHEAVSDVTKAQIGAGVKAGALKAGKALGKQVQKATVAAKKGIAKLGEWE